MTSALITGITGQDGFFLSQLLISKNYEVMGLVRDVNSPTVAKFQILHPEVSLFQADLNNYNEIFEAIQKSAPDEVYNLGGLSAVGTSFLEPERTAQVTGLGALRILEAIKGSNQLNSKIYQASSSEMFGQSQSQLQDEMTPFRPKSPYGVAKVFAHQSCVNYRADYGVQVSCGILFNHESEYRSIDFVTRKITHNVAQIASGKIEKFSLGNIAARRDWGYAKDYVEAMWMMLQQDQPDDYVIATGEAHSVREFLELALRVAGLEGDIEQYVDFDERLIRPAEIDPLVGNAQKAKNRLGWEPRIKFEKLVELMTLHDLNLVKQS